MITRDDLEQFFEYKKIDVPKLAQIAVVTGLFGSEENVIEHLKLIKEVAGERGFKGELMYFGCEVNSDDALKELANLGNFSIIYAIDNFTNRSVVLAKKKSLITLDFAKSTLDSAKEKGIKTSISYIDGLDPLEKLKSGFEYIADSLTDFPIVNVFQMQTSEQSKILTKEASELAYFLQSRIELEKIFKETGLRPKRWSNYRPLWYKSFDNEELPNNSFGQLEKI